jgi:hypothetical protein
MKVALKSVGDDDAIPPSIYNLFYPYDTGIADHHFIAIVILNEREDGGYYQVLYECVTVELDNNMIKLRRQLAANNQVHPAPANDAPTAPDKVAPVCQKITSCIQNEARRLIGETATYDIIRVIVIFPSLYEMSALRFLFRCCCGFPDPAIASHKCSAFTNHLNSCILQTQKNYPTVSVEVYLKTIKYKHGAQIANLVQKVMS